MTAPSSKTWDYDYNALGQVTAVSIPNGMATAYGYDNRNRMTKLDHKYGATVLDGYAYALDASGGITRVTDQNSEYWDYTYDGRQRLVTAVRNNSGAAIAAAYRYTYDAGDNLVTKVEPFKDDFNDGDYTGWTVSTGTWDASNHYLTCSTSLGGIYKSYTYSSSADADLWFSYYDGDTSSTSYYMKVYLRDYLDHVRLEIYSNQMALKEYDYSAGTTTTLATSNATSTQNTWYDVYVRCNGANITVYRAERGSGSEMTQMLSTSSSAVRASGFLRLMTYGSFRFEDLRMASDVLSTTTTYAYNTADELTSSAVGGASTSYSYDYWGRMITKNQQSGAHTATYAYRYDSKLCTVTSSIPDESNVTNNYDGEGKLRSITTGGATKKLRWDAGFHPINLEDANGNLTTTFVHDPAREAAGSVLAAHVGSDPGSGGTWAYLSQDHLGSTRHLRGQDRASLGTYEYTPYGDPYIATGMDLPQEFTGHWQIPQAGLYYAPYRMYVPAIARWMTRDPLGMVDGPNVYGYVRGNPIMRFDPDGRIGPFALCVAGAALGLMGTIIPAVIRNGLGGLGCYDWCSAAVSAVAGCASSLLPFKTYGGKAVQRLGSALGPFLRTLPGGGRLINMIKDVVDWFYELTVLKRIGFTVGVGGGIYGAGGSACNALCGHNASP